MKSIPANERPRERCLEHGPQHLSLRECLAVLIGTGPRGIGCMGVAEELINRCGNGGDTSFFAAMELGLENLVKEQKGLGPAAQARLLVMLELARRFTHANLSEKGSNKRRRIGRKIPARLRNASNEWIGFIPYYSGRGWGDFHLVEKGVRSHVNFDPGKLFGKILMLNSDGFRLFHNHPCGSLEPSSEDLELTAVVEEIADSLGLDFYGHWVVGSQGSQEINASSSEA